MLTFSVKFQIFSVELFKESVRIAAYFSRKFWYLRLADVSCTLSYLDILLCWWNSELRFNIDFCTSSALFDRRTDSRVKKSYSSLDCIIPSRLWSLSSRFFCCCTFLRPWIRVLPIIRAISKSAAHVSWISIFIKNVSPNLIVSGAQLLLVSLVLSIVNTCLFVWTSWSPFA